MNMAILRVTGDNEAVRRVRQQYRLAIYDSWSKGDKGLCDRLLTNSGFSISLEDTNSPSQMLSSVNKLLSDFYEQGLDFNAHNVNAELDTGFCVGQQTQFAASYSLTQSMMKLALATGVNFTFTAYPEDDDDEPS